jgi:hypothetical protein
VHSLLLAPDSRNVVLRQRWALDDMTLAQAL